MLFSLHWTNITDAGPAGILILLWLGTAVLLALVALSVALIKPRDIGAGLLRVLSLASLGSFGFGLVTSCLLVMKVQRSILRSSGGAPPSGLTPWEWWNEAMERCETVHAFVGLALLAMVTILGLSLGIQRWRSGHTRSRSLLRIVLPFAVLLGVAAAIGILRRAYAAMHPPISALMAYEVGWVEKQGALRLAGARIHVLLIAALGSAWLVLAARRAQTRPSLEAVPKNRSLAFVVFGMGLASFLGTRPLAHDASAPLPRPLNLFLACPEDPSVDPSGLPEVAGCEKSCASFPYSESRYGPVLDLGAGGARLDGVAVENPAVLGQMLTAKKSLWHEEEQTQRSPPVLRIASPKEARIEDLAPWLSAIQASYGSASIVVLHAQKVESTATAGPIERTPRCCCAPLELDDGGRPVSGFERWGELAREVVAAPEDAPLRVRP